MSETLSTLENMVAARVVTLNTDTQTEKNGKKVGDQIIK